MKFIFFIALFFSLGASGFAQGVGTCEPGRAYADLDVNQVSARLYNHGSLFSTLMWPDEDPVSIIPLPNWYYSRRIQPLPSGPGYEVPKGSGRHALHTLGFWLGGLRDGQLHMVATLGEAWDLYPGPMPDRPHAYCRAYDRLYSIKRTDLVRYENTGHVTRDLVYWPVDWGAPVIDGDGISGNYNLKGGDRPKLIGDQTVWWVMNDVGNEHAWSYTPPIGLEIQATAFAANQICGADGGTFTPPALRYTTFYRYQLINRSPEPLEETWMGLWLQSGLGNPNDDYAGSDPNRNLGFFYNALPYDYNLNPVRQPPILGYGSKPPALGVLLLRAGHERLPDRPLADKFLVHQNNATVQGNPDSGDDAYRYLRGLWRDDVPITDCPRCFGPRVVDYMYPADPPAFWSEMNIDDAGSSSPPGERRFVLSSKLGTLEPGKTEEIAFAVIWSQGEDHLDSIWQLKEDADVMRVAYEALISTSCPVKPMQKAADIAPERYLLHQPYPNPFTDRVTLRYELPRPQRVNLTVYDVLGRPVAVLAEEEQVPGTHEVIFEAAGLPPGLYLARLRLGHLERTVSLIHQP